MSWKGRITKRSHTLFLVKVLVYQGCQGEYTAGVVRNSQKGITMSSTRKVAKT